MKDIFEKDLSGEMISPNEPGYDAPIAFCKNHQKIESEK